MEVNVFLQLFNTRLESEARKWSEGYFHMMMMM